MILNEKNTLVEDVFNSFGGPTVGANIDPNRSLPVSYSALLWCRVVFARSLLNHVPSHEKREMAPFFTARAVLCTHHHHVDPRSS